MVRIPTKLRLFKEGGLARSLIAHLLKYSLLDYVVYCILGLINTHVHTSQQLARGIADDVDLLTWLHHRIWPYESNMTEEDSYISTLLCGIELIHSGVSSLGSIFQLKSFFSTLKLVDIW